jgi:UDP-N-acetylmuramoylalanine--D-glutamate ligase
MKVDRVVRGQNVVVLGLARQGTALARWLVDHGAQVTVSDAKPAAELSDALHALRGSPVRYELDGHPLSLLDRCDLLCLSGGVPTDLPIVQEARKRGIPLANDAQLFLERCPAKAIGITGSAGKTTTTALVGEMGRSKSATGASATGVASYRVWVGGNIGNPLIADLDSMASSDLVVMELSSFQLELMTVSPPVAALLNVTPNHLDRHASMDAYIAAKARILDFQSPQDTAVIGYDDAVARSLASRATGAVRFFGAGDWSRLPRLPHCTVKGDQVVLVKDRDTSVCALSDIRLRGGHNVLNVLAACALADAVGISTEAMRSAISSFTGVSHRLQLVKEVNGVRYYDDSIATAPERLIADIQSFHEPIVLLAGGRDKHLPWDDAAELINRRVRQLIVFGEMAELVERAVTVKRSEIGDSGALEGLHRVGTLAEAVAKAAEAARPGDVVLLAPGGTSFDAFKDFAERGDKFQEYVRGL